MTGVSRQELHDLTYDVYEASYTSDYYIRLCSEDAGPGLEFQDTDPISLTALYAAAETRKLHKAYFPNPNLPYNESGSARTQFAEDLTGTLLHQTDGEAKHLSGVIQRAVDGYFDNLTESKPPNAVHLLGVTALHHGYQQQLIDGREIGAQQGMYVVFNPYTVSVMVSPKPFLDTYLEDYSYDTGLDEIAESWGTSNSEEKLEQMYAIQSEHTEGIASFEEFKELIKEIVDPIHREEAGITGRGIATVALGLAMLPKKYTHPVIQRELFA